MSNPAPIKPKRKNKDQIVRYRCDRPLIVDFDQRAASEKKTRSQVLRELMTGWVENRKTA